MSAPSVPQLFQALFPGQQYSDDRAPELAARLREVAEDLQPGSSEAAQPGPEAQAGEEPSKKRRKKDSDGKGTLIQNAVPGD
jgi:hypothetical protein